MIRLEHVPFPLVLAAPSGVGKTTVARALCAAEPHVVFSVSATTRPPRAGERDGVDYWFLTEAEFRARVAAGAMLEWAEVHGHLYGTPRANLEAAQAEGRHLLLDIDVQGAQQVRQRVPGTVLVFLLPPSVEVWLARLRRRGSEDAAALQRRLEAARRELLAAAEFDYIVVNDALEETVATMRAILRAEEGRTTRLRGLEAWLHRLAADLDRAAQTV